MAASRANLAKRLRTGNNQLINYVPPHETHFIVADTILTLIFCY